MTREWHKPDRRIGVSLDVDGLTWWYAEVTRDQRGTKTSWLDSGHFWQVFKFSAVVRRYRRGKG